MSKFSSILKIISAKSTILTINAINDCNIVCGDFMFKDRLRYLREHQELSQADVCQRLDISASSYTMNV